MLKFTMKYLKQPIRGMALAACVGVTLLTACATSTQEAAEKKPAPVAATPDKNSLNAILTGAHRSDANRARDKYRNPTETLAFFGVKPSSTVIEIAPGGGWYTEILAPYTREKGNYIAAFPAQATRGLKNFQDKLATAPALYDKTKIVPFGTPDNLNIRPDGGADAVLTFRNVHNWMKPDNDTQVDAFMKSFFDALKPGGVLGVVEHRATPGTLQKDSITSGYVTEQYVIERAVAAGFKLDAKSEINANPRDTKNYPKGVWTLPPVLAEKELNRDQYLAIGESDRMTLRFIKPTK